SGRWLLQGLGTTLAISSLAWLLAVGLGILSGALRTVPWKALRAVAAFYVEFFRNVPLLVWMFFWYFGVPPLLPEAAREWLFDHGAEFWAGMFALGVYHGARMSEVIRSGIQSIPKTQFEAAVAMGLTSSAASRSPASSRAAGEPVLDLSVIVNNFAFLVVQGLLGLGGFTGGTLRLAIPAIVLGFVLGIFIGIARLARAWWISLPATLYVEFFRGVPLVMVIFWIWFIIPQLLRRPIPEYGVALTAFVVFEAAYFG